VSIEFCFEEVNCQPDGLEIVYLLSMYLYSVDKIESSQAKTNPLLMFISAFYFVF
jgi:hypothetical protein